MKIDAYFWIFNLKYNNFLFEEQSFTVLNYYFVVKSEFIERICLSSTLLYYQKID